MKPTDNPDPEWFKKVTVAPECNCGCHGIPDRGPWLCEACGHGEPRAVAEFECVTCRENPYKSPRWRLITPAMIRYHRAAGHDIRPAGGKHDAK